MNSAFRRLSALMVATLLGTPVFAGAQASPPATSQEKKDPQKPAPAETQKPDPQKPDPQKPRPARSRTPRSRTTTSSTKRHLVVSASRYEEKLVNAPATMSVITALQIEQAPSQNFAELLRSIPGSTSRRCRHATST